MFCKNYIAETQLRYEPVFKYGFMSVIIEERLVQLGVERQMPERKYPDRKSGTGYQGGMIGRRLRSLCAVDAVKKKRKSLMGGKTAVGGGAHTCRVSGNIQTDQTKRTTGRHFT